MNGIPITKQTKKSNERPCPLLRSCVHLSSDIMLWKLTSFILVLLSLSWVLQKIQSSEVQCSCKTEEHLFLIFKPWFAKTASQDKQSCFHKSPGTAGIIFILNFNAIMLTFHMKQKVLSYISVWKCERHPGLTLL